MFRVSGQAIRRVSTYRIAGQVLQVLTVFFMKLCTGTHIILVLDEF